MAISLETVVYKALASTPPTRDRQVALELLREPLAAASVRVVREAQVLAKLAHPNVVAVNDVGELHETRRARASDGIAPRDRGDHVTRAGLCLAHHAGLCAAALPPTLRPCPR